MRLLGLADAVEMSYPEIILWVGPERTCPVTELTREELIEALEYASRELSNFRRPGISKAIAVGQVELMRRGEWPVTGSKS